MRVLLGHGRGGVGGDIMSKDDVVQGKVHRRSVGEVGNNQSICFVFGPLRMSDESRCSKRIEETYREHLGVRGGRPDR